MTVLSVISVIAGIIAHRKRLPTIVTTVAMFPAVPMAVVWGQILILWIEYGGR